MSGYKENKHVNDTVVCKKSKKLSKKRVFIKIWKFAVNFCDILGLLDILPCGTIHSIKPYINYGISIKIR